MIFCSEIDPLCLNPLNDELYEVEPERARPQPDRASF